MQQRQRLKLLTYNIQVGIETSAYHHYFTRAWRHVLPCPTRQENLNRTAELLSEYDMVALQETDAGSVRSRYVNQVAYLAERAGFPFYWTQVNRNLGRFARHSLGFLSRYEPTDVEEARLPGRIPGRGTMLVRFGHGDDSLLVVVAHLSLGRRSRQQQLAFIRERIGNHPHVALMGDLNCGSADVIHASALRDTKLRGGSHGVASYPSWRPKRHLDHILVTPGLEIHHSQVVQHHTVSDHLPLAMELSLPDKLLLQTAPVKSN